MKRKIIWAVMIALFAWLLFELDHCMSVDTCLDFDKVWDYNENRCREDCLTWTKKNGCIEMSPEFYRLLQACGKKSAACDEEKFDKLYIEMCQKYNSPIDPEDGFCSFE